MRRFSRGMTGPRLGRVSRKQESSMTYYPSCRPKAGLSIEVLAPRVSNGRMFGSSHRVVSGFLARSQSSSIRGRCQRVSLVPEVITELVDSLQSILDHKGLRSLGGAS